MPAIISYSEILSWYPSIKRFAIRLSACFLPEACFPVPAQAAEPSISVWSNPRLSLIQTSQSAYSNRVHLVDFAVVNRQWRTISGGRGLSR